MQPFYHISFIFYFSVGEVLKFYRRRLQQIYLWANIFHAISIWQWFIYSAWCWKIDGCRLVTHRVMIHFWWITKYPINTVNPNVSIRTMDESHRKGKKCFNETLLVMGKAAHCESKRLLKLRTEFRKSGTNMKINWAQMMFANLLIGNYPSNDFVENQHRKWFSFNPQQYNLRKSFSSQTGWIPVWLRADFFFPRRIKRLNCLTKTILRIGSCFTHCCQWNCAWISV